MRHTSHRNSTTKSRGFDVPHHFPAPTSSRSALQATRARSFALCVCVSNSIFRSPRVSSPSETLAPTQQFGKKSALIRVRGGPVWSGVSRGSGVSGVSGLSGSRLLVCLFLLTSLTSLCVCFFFPSLSLVCLFLFLPPLLVCLFLFPFPPSLCVCVFGSSCHERLLHQGCDQH